MRIRTIKPEFFDSPHTAQASAVLRLAYIGLWCWADDTGHGTCNPKELEGAIFPNDDLNTLSNGEFADFRGILPQLAAVFGVVFYELDGRAYFEIPSWSRHQRVRDGSSSKFPSPADGKPLFTCENIAQSDNLPQSAASCGKTPPGTGEQGNRGTGEYPPNPPHAGGAGDEPQDTTFELIPAPTADADFDEFWATYPRREGKDQARKAWRKAIKRAKPAEIIAGAARYRDDPNRDPAYTKHPGPWLNAGRWADDPLPQRARPAPVRETTSDRVQGWIALGQQLAHDPRKEIGA